MPPSRGTPMTSSTPDAGTDISSPITALASSSSLTLAKHDIKPAGWVHFAAGGLGGMCGAIVTAPFDLVKTRLQSSLFREVEQATSGKGKARAVEAVQRGRVGALLHHFVETGVILKTVYTDEGPRALFRGLGPTLVGVIPGRSINFFAYGNGKPFYASHLSLSPDSALVHLLAAATAGVITATATNPIWVVKTRLQLQQQAVVAGGAGGGVKWENGERKPPRTRGGDAQRFAPSFRTMATTASATLTTSRTPVYIRPFPSSFECILHIWKHERLAGFYKGLSASYLGVAEGTIQWTLYERFKLWSRGGRPEGEEGWLAKVGAAGGAKLVATALTYPHEVVRTRMRQVPPPLPALPKYTGLLETFRVVLREEGVAAFYGGLSPHLLRVVPNAAVMYTVYELALGLSRKREARRLGYVDE